MAVLSGNQIVIDRDYVDNYAMKKFTENELMKKYFDTFAERKQYEATTSREILDYGVEFVCGVKKYYLILK